MKRAEPHRFPSPERVLAEPDRATGQELRVHLSPLASKRNPIQFSSLGRGFVSSGRELVGQSS